MCTEQQLTLSEKYITAEDSLAENEEWPTITSLLFTSGSIFYLLFSHYFHLLVGDNEKKLTHGSS